MKISIQRAYAILTVKFMYKNKTKKKTNNHNNKMGKKKQQY